MADLLSTWQDNKSAMENKKYTEGLETGNNIVHLRKMRYEGLYFLSSQWQEQFMIVSCEVDLELILNTH